MLEFYGLFPVIVSFIVVKLCHWIYRWTNPKCKGKLPPGSMGFPIIGETFEFMTAYDFSSAVSPYLEKRISRYGSKVFRTSLFGAKAIISTDQEVNMEMAKASTQCGAPESLRRLFGENSDFLQRKEIHKYVRNLTSRFVGPENLKNRLLQDIDVLSRNYFKIEKGATSISFDIKEAATKMEVELIVKKVFGEMESEAVRELGLCWTAFRTNWFNFSYNFPGTTVYRLVKARRRAAKLLKGLIQKKNASKEGLGDFLDIDRAVDLILTFFIISQETTPTILGATVKLVADNPDVMEELKVIKESLRFTSAQPTVHRIPTEDVQIGGYTIPAGWFFFGIPLVHFDEEKYEDPLKFNPWRWKGKYLHGTLSKDYIPLCVGSEFAKCIIAVFLHHLSIFRWSLDPKTRVLRRYMLMFPAGCKVEIAKEPSS
ncbi:unnamed protein product [Thlaspi arvense]|uniref:Cytochrome P450 n=1 Tax=Thlaspi arvense TaxID=13288 RepID=A0AAU9T5Q4_THLAR|nr:unnamed protein product [Thlaspi arvense]